MRSGGVDLKLLGSRPGPFSWRIIWALKWKGLEYEYVEEDLVSKRSLLLELNPIHKRVPVLLHCEKPICESLIILEYIDENWKQNPILPEDPQMRARARFLAKFAEEKFIESARQLLRTTGEEQARALALTSEAMEILESEISGKKFFGGHKMGYVDIAVGWSAYWLQFVEEVACVKAMDSTKYPFLDLWMKYFIQLPLIKNNLPQPQEILSHYHHYRNMVLSKSSD